MKVLEYVHHAPFSGCFWRYEYLLVQENRGTIEIVDTIVSSKREPDADTIREGLLTEFSRIGQFSEFKLFDIDNDLHSSIPATYYPEFYDALLNHRLPFTWYCDDCGKTQERPLHSDNYSGNGGVGIEYHGWTCEECYLANMCPECSEQLDSESKLCWSCDDTCQECHTLIEAGTTYCSDCQEYINECGE